MIMLKIIRQTQPKELRLAIKKNHSKILGVDYDPKGDMKVDVKTKQTSVKPLPHYECSIAKLNTNQKCDAYAFVRILNDFSKGWFLGVLTKDDYYAKATFLRKGDVDPSNNYTVKADCYNVRIDELGEGL